MDLDFDGMVIHVRRAYVPDLDSLPRNKPNQDISIEWLKNRNIPPPPDVVSK